MTVVSDIDDDGFLPAKQEVASASAERDGYTQPHVVRHEDQHEEVTDDHLYNVQQCLEAVTQAQHARSVGKTIIDSLQLQCFN